MKTREEILEEIKEIIFSSLGVNSLAAVKAKLLQAAKYEYGGRTATIDTGKGIKLIYTDNSNCFASYIVTLKGRGMSSQYAIDKSSITQAGKSRGCFDKNHYLFE